MGIIKKAPTNNALTASAQNANVGSISVTYSKQDILDVLKAQAKENETMASIDEQQQNVDVETPVTEEVDIAEDSVNMHFFDVNISNEVVSELNKCKNTLPYKLTNSNVLSLKSKYGKNNVDIDFDDVDNDNELYEGMSIEVKGKDIIINMDMRGDFVKAINTNTKALREKWKTKLDQLKSRYMDEENNFIDDKSVKKYNAEYETAYKELIEEELNFLLGPETNTLSKKRDDKQSIMGLFAENLKMVKEKLITDAPDETKVDYKKLKKNFAVDVEASTPIKIVTGYDSEKQDWKTVDINTEITITLKYKKKKGGDFKEIASCKFNLLKSK